MKTRHAYASLLCLHLFLAACAHHSSYQVSASYTTLNISLIDGGFMKADKPVVKVRAINGSPIEDWGGGILGNIHGRSFDIPAGSVFVEMFPPDGYGFYSGYAGYVRFDAQQGETYTLSYRLDPHQRFTLMVKDSAGKLIYSHDFPQNYRCTYGDADIRLIDAIAFQDAGKVKKLLDDGVDPNRLKCGAWHPLPLAAKDNNVQILRLLLAAGAQADGFDGVKAIRHALKSDNLDMIKLLVTNGADINLRKDHFINSLLMDAAEQGNVRFVKFLLEHSAYTKFRNRDGKTASLLASEAGHRKIVDLINNHAD